VTGVTAALSSAAAAGEIMYVADAAAALIYRYAVDATGNITGGDVFVQVAPDEGSPDDMTVDDAKRLWVAMWGGSSVR
jgi:sugar lactone lactonase YvrE